MSDAVRRAKQELSGASIRNKSKTDAESMPAVFRGINLDARFYNHLALVSVMVLSLIWAIRILPDGMLGDEGFHWTQIVTFLNGGDFSSYITTIPGYHLCMTYLIKALSWMKVIPPESLPAARCLNWVLSLPAVVCFYLMVRKSGEGNSTALSLQLFLSPIIFPFFFLVYTDMTSVSLLMLAALLVMGDRYHLAAIVAGISILFRQTNIMWLFLFWLLALHNAGFFGAFRNVIGSGKFKLNDYVGPLRKTCIFPVFCILFVGFVFLNKGVAVGDVESHTLGAIYPTQIFLLLCTIYFLFLPLHIKNAPAIWRLLKSQPLLPFIGAILYAVYIITFDATHDYNYHSFYLRNHFLTWLRDSMAIRSLFFIPMLWAFYNLLVTPLRKKSYYWLYPIVMLYMLPIGLIEPRYFIVPIVLFMLFRKPENDHLEYFSAAIYIPISIFFVIGIAEENFFL